MSARLKKSYRNFLYNGNGVARIFTVYSIALMKPRDEKCDGRGKRFVFSVRGERKSPDIASGKILTPCL
jgi:hypothetical protein